MLHEAMFLDTQENASTIADVRLIIAVDPAQSIPYFRGKAVRAHGFIAQEGADIGFRMSNCFNRFCDGQNAVVLIGMDVPTLPVSRISDAFDRLNDHPGEVVLGPSIDGGYHLVGMTVPHPDLFHNMRWSTPDVLNASLERCKALGLTTFQLPPWHDVDTRQDLYRLVTALFEGTDRAQAVNTKTVLRDLIERGMI
jgi:hypothetical protein